MGGVLAASGPVAPTAANQPYEPRGDSESNRRGTRKAIRLCQVEGWVSGMLTDLCTLYAGGSMYGFLPGKVTELDELVVRYPCRHGPTGAIKAVAGTCVG